MTSIFRLPAFKGVSNLDTGAELSRKPRNVPKSKAQGQRQRRGRRTQPVSNPDTGPVSKFAPRTDKEQSIDTGEGRAGERKDAEEDPDEKAVVFPDPCIPLTTSALAIRNAILRSAFGQLFMERVAIQTALGL